MHVPMFLHPTAKPAPLLQRLLVAVTSVALAFLFALLFPPLHDADGAFLLFFTAIFISAWYGGLAPGLLATVLGTLLGDYFFIPPPQTILVYNSAENARLLTFVLEGVLASVLSDITRFAYEQAQRELAERRKAEGELKDALVREQIARGEAEKADALKLQFLGMVSHELRTPLTSIKGFTSTLLAEDIGWEPEIQRDFIRIIDEEADKLTGLIEQLLNVSRLRAGTFSILPVPASLVATVNAIMPDLQRLAVNHPLKVNLPSDLPRVVIDSTRIGQVFVNLVDNACKYATPGSPIEICAAPEDRMVHVEIRDYGPGIPPAERDAVFDAFHRLDPRSHERGAGLGLSIVRGIVEGHGGRIWIADTGAPGTTFSFTLPIAG